MRYFLEFIIEYEGKFASMEEKRVNYLNEYTRLLDTQEYIRLLDKPYVNEVILIGQNIG